MKFKIYACILNTNLNVINKGNDLKNECTGITMGQIVFHPILFSFASLQSHAPGNLPIHQKSNFLTTLYENCFIFPFSSFRIDSCTDACPHTHLQHSQLLNFLFHYHSSSSKLWKSRRQVGHVNVSSRVIIYLMHGCESQTINTFDMRGVAFLWS